jgi:hypothetical protein
MVMSGMYIGLLLQILYLYVQYVKCRQLIPLCHDVGDRIDRHAVTTKKIIGKLKIKGEKE